MQENLTKTVKDISIILGGVTYERIYSKKKKELRKIYMQNRGENARENNKVPEDQKLYFPFIVIEFPANKDPKINVALNDNKTKAHFGFDEVISMYGDLDAVSKIGNHPNFSKSK